MLLNINNWKSINLLTVWVTGVFKAVLM